MEFEFYDRSLELRITQRDLPHWFQPGVTYFITFRTADSVPADVLRRWHSQRNDWLHRHGVRPNDAADTVSDTIAGGTLRVPNSRTRSVRTTEGPAGGQATTALPQGLSAAEQREYHRLFSRQFMEYLDRGYGECLLKRPNLAEIVANSLRHGDTNGYHLGDFVIMPNHVHLLVCLAEGNDLEKLCYSWKKYTATQINRMLGRRGRFWQEESFDHLVRGPGQFEGFCRYIAENPSKAKLRKGEYLLWQKPM
jgi:putative transposase